jgi:hypothetical protein
MKRILAAAAVAALAVAGVAAAQSDEPVDFALDCTLTGRVVECVGELPAPATTEPPASTSTSSSSTTSTTPTTSSTSTTSSTTTSSTTTTSTSSSTTTSTTTAPPAGDAFLATFATPSDFYDRFDTYTGNYCTFGTSCRPEDIPSGVDRFVGDHSHGCEGPTTQRDVHVANHSNLFWWCAPNGPDSGHVMVGMATSGYAITAFTPRQSFTDVRSVCWDQNLTDLGGGKWFTVTLVPDDVYFSHRNENPRRLEEREGEYRLDYTLPEFDVDNAPGDFNLQQQPRWMFKLFQDSLSVADRTGRAGLIIGFSTGGGFQAGDDKATRFRHCLTEDAGGDVILTQNSPTGLRTWNTQTRFPDGPVHVIFADDTYDSEKHGPTPHKTWHVDNIEIR